MKDEKIAEKLRQDGNNMYKQRKFIESLISYNKSLCCSPLDSINISFVYANRSAVYFEMQQYEKCLENIELALHHKHPNKDRLLKRKENCRELPRGCNILKFFNLSYPINEMIPSIISCLELREDDKFGRYIVTTENLNPGDIIAFEDACFKSLDISARFKRCAFCLSFNKLSLIPCDRGCSCTMFCNENCQTEGLKRFHAVECEMADDAYNSEETGSKIFHPFDMLRALTESLVITQPVERECLLEQSMLMDDEEPKTVFDFDLGLKADEWLEVKQLQIVNLLMPGSDENLQWILEDTACRLLEKFPVFEQVVSSDDNYEFLVQYIVRFMQILKHNNSKIIRSQKVEGTATQLFGSLLSHSCDPNVVNIPVDNKFAIIVTKPIKKGHQVFVNYKATFDVEPNREKRRSKLLRDYNFICDCVACELDLKFMELPKIDPNFNCPHFKLPGTFDAAAKEFKENCQYIKANFDAYPCLELSVLEVRNKALLALIADKAMWCQ